MFLKQIIKQQQQQQKRIKEQKEQNLSDKYSST